MRPAWLRPAWADVDLDAIVHNAGVLSRAAQPAFLCAVVKADGYGHGAVPVARAALAGGASWLAVALVEEGIALREAGIDAPVLVLSEPSPEVIVEGMRWSLTPTVYTPAGLDAAAAGRRPGGPPVAVHVKVDTGMHRVGADPPDAEKLAVAAASHPDLRLQGFWTHMPVADEDEDYTAAQLARFDAAVVSLAAAGVVPDIVHAANSAGTLLHPGSRRDMVRCGISLYGYPPAVHHAGVADLRPAMSLKARVAYVRRLEAGERLSYGRRYSLPHDSVVATLPIGYADGVPRQLSAQGGVALVGGRPRPLAGTVTMDQVMVDCGPDSDVAPGDEVVLLGRQGDARITADDWAQLCGTISYEIVCGIAARVPRHYRGGPAATDDSAPVTGSGERP